MNHTFAPEESQHDAAQTEVSQHLGAFAQRLKAGEGRKGAFLTYLALWHTVGEASIAHACLHWK